MQTSVLVELIILVSGQWIQHQGRKEISGITYYFVSDHFSLVPKGWDWSPLSIRNNLLHPLQNFQTFLGADQQSRAL